MQNKINRLTSLVSKLQNKLYKKEQECEELKQWKKGAESLFKAQIDNTDKIINRYKQTPDEIKKTCLFKIENRQFVLPNVWQHFLNIINKAKDNK